MILSPSSEKVKKKLRQYATKDIAPGLNHVQFRENEISFYSPNIFDCAPTMKYQGYFPIFICDLLKVRNCRNIYGSGGYEASSNNIVMLKNHPLQKVMICGKILGESYHEISAKKAYHSLLISDGSTGDFLTVKIGRSLYMQSFQDTYRNPSRLLSICGEVTFFNDKPELSVHYTSQVGNIGDLTAEIKWWELTNQIRKTYLKDPWIFNTTINLAPCRIPFTDYTVHNSPCATSSFVATDSEFYTQTNENSPIINSDIATAKHNNNNTLVNENRQTNLPCIPDDVDHQMFSEIQMYVPKVKFLRTDFSREMRVKKLTREVELIQHARQIKVRDYDSFKISRKRLRKTVANNREAKNLTNSAIIEETINVDDSDYNEVDFKSEYIDTTNYDDYNRKQKVLFEKPASEKESERDDADHYPVIISEDCFRNSKNYSKLNRYLERQGISESEFSKHDKSFPKGQELTDLVGISEVDAEPESISENIDEIITIDSSDIEDPNDLNDDSCPYFEDKGDELIQERLESERHEEAIFFSESHQSSIAIIRESTFKIELIKFFTSYPSSKISTEDLISYPSLLKTCRDIAYCNIVNSSFTEKQYTLLSDRLTEDEVCKEEKRIVHNTRKNMIDSNLLEPSDFDYFHFETIQKIARLISDILKSKTIEEKEEITCIMKKLHKNSLHICDQDFYFRSLKSLIDKSSFPRLSMKSLSWLIQTECQGALLTPIEVAEIIKHLVEIHSNGISKYENIACSYGYSVCLLWKFEHTDTIDMEWQFTPIILDRNNTLPN
ncbi:unnamed protein product [[Candida] boidinii]|uniref:Unnamed protein product n=1 Tax=Candida boidinii TaxID=5477 RepID=A0A9W6T029_CANBO|nr:hypothetical protein B5S30_g3502 [[Candida] boidinii]OWB83352.1 hypothetical protein B5S33_g1981 [[Candida] boidinii]GME71772.1 unnamed protein product [[Candida] boidinii]